MSDGLLARITGWARARIEPPQAHPQRTRAPHPENHWTRVARMFETLQSEPALRPVYTWSVLHAVSVARHLGIPRMSVLEFGVAGGNGLIALERAAAWAESMLGVSVEVFGFDTGHGLPPPRDHRDAPFLMAGGQFSMDEATLRPRLHRAELILGSVGDTISTFLERRPPPVGFVSLDLDYYSSTSEALALFDGDQTLFLPRVLCYVDDSLGYPWGDVLGARLAIDEFNAARAARKIAHIPGFRYLAPPSQFHARWTEAMYLAHLFDHARYADEEGTSLVTRLDLEGER